MTTAKSKGPIINPGLCRCCGLSKKCRVLNVAYESYGQKEIYSDIIMDCFGLLLSHLEGDTKERLVCATCVLRLREANIFRQQVVKCEQAFLKAKLCDVETKDKPKVPHEVPLEEKMKAQLYDTEIYEPISPYESTPEDTNIHGEDNNIKLKNLKVATDNNIKLKNLKVATDTKKLPLKKIIPKKPLPKAAPQRVQVKRMVVKRPIKTESMQVIQKRIREGDPTYLTDTNIFTVVEFSYACPFKCRHNHLLCYYCGQHFSDPTLLREHTHASHSPKKFKLTEHKSMLKVDLTWIDCRLCDEKIDSLDDFKQHITKCHDKKYYFNNKDLLLPFKFTKDNIKCALCDDTFLYFHALNRHMNEHYSNYVCETCGLGFVDNGRFMVHQQRHEKGSDFPCEICGKTFKAMYNRDLHVDRVHKKRGRVYCPKCDVTLMTYPQKLKHLVEVHGEKPLSFPCSQCDRVFDARRTLTLHRRKDHLKDYRYECQCCGQRFFTKFALNNHMPTHTGERNFTCKVCGKSYPRLKSLQYHTRIHNNDRRYRCELCGQAFVQNCSLKGHMKSQHPEYS